MAELMSRFLAVLGLLLALCGAGVRPADAYPAQRAAVLSGSPCTGKTASLDLAASSGVGVYCLNGTRYSSPTFIPGWSFTRASTESCQWADGHLTTAAAGVPCITDLGLGIWESRTNSFLNSAIGATQSLTTTAASWTLSFYGTGTIVMTGTCSGTLAGTGATVRVSSTITATAGSCTLTVSGSTADVNMEAGAFPTPWISTTGTAATRAADVASIGSLLLPAAGTWTAQYIPSNFANNRRIISGPASGNFTTPLLMNGVSGAVSAYDSAAIAPTANTGTLNAVNKGATGYDGSGTSVVLNGGTVATGIAGTFSSLTTIYLGNDNSGTAGDVLDGYLQRVTLYPSRLSNAQLQALTQ